MINWFGKCNFVVGMDQNFSGGMQDARPQDVKDIK
jgi:hypothetical protein